MESAECLSKAPSRAVYCLRCSKPQTHLESHMRKMCLKGADDAVIQEEVAKAKASQRTWMRDGRVLDFSEVRRLVSEDPSCDSLAEYFQAKGFLIDSSAVSDLRVLALAEHDMAEVSNRLGQQKNVPPRILTEYRNFCLAILMWTHHLGPTGVKEIKVQEWNNRLTEGDTIVLRLSRRSVTLSRKEEQWLDCYFRHVRPLSLKAQAPGVDDGGCFFLGNSALPLCNPTADVQRLRARYVKKHSGGPAPPKEPLPGTEASPSAEEERPSTSGLPLPSPPKLWGAFQEQFPVSLNGNPPSKSEAGYSDRCYYHHWRRLQYKLRTRYIIKQCSDRSGQKPSAARVQRAIARETGWTTNVPTVDSVLHEWGPCQEQSPAANDTLLVASVVHQTWKGLAIKSFKGKGKGVITTMCFPKNQVLCDYHGEVVSKKEGERRLETLTGEPSYLFFFKGMGGAPLCIDAQKWPCECHPGKETFGRRINHSRRRTNVWPQRVILTCPDGPRECVLFRALRDIAVGEEVLWDYGLHRSTFGGKGRGPPWLDT